MTTNSQLSTTESKKQNQKLNKHLEWEQNHRIEITWKVASGEGKGENGGKGRGNKKYKW